MKYYLSLAGIFAALLVVDLFLSRLFMHANISVALAFLLSAAFMAPQKTRFVYRTLVPVILVCGLIADSLSAVIPGAIFFGYVVLALVVIEISRNIPSADSIWTLIVIVFCATLLFRLIVGLVSNHYGVEVVVSSFTASLFSAIYTSVFAIGITYLFDTPFGDGVGKIIFNSDS